VFIGQGLDYPGDLRAVRDVPAGCRNSTQSTAKRAHAPGTHQVERISPQDWPSNFDEYVAKLKPDALGVVSAGITEMPNTKLAD